MQTLVHHILAKHRESPPAGLSMVLPFHHHMDTDFCNAISADIQNLSTAWEKRRATRDLWKQLPAQSGIYMFVFTSPLHLITGTASYSPSWILYVGRAGNATSRRTIRDRYRHEYAKYIEQDPEILWTAPTPRSREERLSLYLTIYPLEFWFLTIERRENIPVIEDRLIKLLAPPINIQQQPRLRPQRPQDAFRRL